MTKSKVWWSDINKRKNAVIALLLVALIVMSALFGWALVAKRTFEENVAVRSWLALQTQTSDYKFIPSTDNNAYMVVGEGVSDSDSMQSWGGRVSILPDIIPGQYLVDYWVKTLDVHYNFSYREYTYYQVYEVSLYDIDNPDVLLKEMDLKTLLEEQYPGRRLTNENGIPGSANGYATVYNERPCILVRVYDPAQDTREKGKYSEDAPIQVMALDVETEVLTDVEDETVFAGRWNQEMSMTSMNRKKDDELAEPLGPKSEYRKTHGIPFSARTNPFIEGGITLRLEDTNIEGYDAPICDMFPTLLQEARGMNWGDRMEIFLYGDIPTEQLVELVMPR